MRERSDGRIGLFHRFFFAHIPAHIKGDGFILLTFPSPSFMICSSFEPEGGIAAKIQEKNWENNLFAKPWRKSPKLLSCRGTPSRS
jgi:hypothetical protein